MVVSVRSSYWLLSWAYKTKTMIVTQIVLAHCKEEKDVVNSSLVAASYYNNAMGRLPWCICEWIEEDLCRHCRRKHAT